jgi:Fe-Mn family superoxide dismutase
LKQQAPNPTGQARVPTGRVADLITKSFGSFDAFKTKFSASAGGHFGSGWAWLVLNPADGLLQVVDTHDAGNPMTGTPVAALYRWLSQMAWFRF